MSPAMLTVSAIVLTVTALGGLCLFALYQWGKPAGAVWLPGAAHGALGAIGLLLLVGSLYGPWQGPPRGATTGSSQFGALGAAMLGIGFVLGAAIFLGRLSRRPPASLVLGLHAALAVGGLVMLAAYLSAGP